MDFPFDPFFLLDSGLELTIDFFAVKCLLIVVMRLISLDYDSLFVVLSQLICKNLHFQNVSLLLLVLVLCWKVP